jgi:pimeloyl-ACP methyl ester carboxylesterase
MNAPIRAGFRILSAVSPALAGRVAARFWFRIPKPPIGDSAKRFLETGERRDLTTNGRRVAVWQWGGGPTVIFVHGWGGYAGQYQAIVPAAVAAGFRAIIFDAPSHGYSDRGALGPRHSTLFEFADTLREIARGTGGLAGIVAHSGGAAAVAWALRQDPTLRVRKLVFVAPFGRALPYMELFRKALGISEEALRRFQRSTEAQFGFLWSDFDVPAMAARMTTPPLLVVHDTEDRETSWQDGADIAAAWPGARLESTTGLGHNRILRDPVVVTSIVQFLTAT